MAWSSTEREVLFNKHSIESESYVTRLVNGNLEFRPRAFEVLIRYVKWQSDFTKVFDIQINYTPLLLVSKGFNG